MCVFSSNSFVKNRSKRTSPWSMSPSIRFVRIEQRIKLSRKPRIIVSESDWSLTTPFCSSSVYIRASPATASILTDYVDLIQPLAKIDQVQLLKDEPTTEYIEIVATPEYQFYFKSQWTWEVVFNSCRWCLNRSRERTLFTNFKKRNYVILDNIMSVTDEDQALLLFQQSSHPRTERANLTEEQLNKYESWKSQPGMAHIKLE